MKFRPLALIAATTLMFSCVSQAEEMTVADGVFTADQAAAGESTFNDKCKSCHDMKFYRNTLRSWKNQPLLFLWETVMGSMPADNPSSLGYDEYTNVIAYVLQENGFPAGEHTLDPDNGMENIKILAP